MDGMTTNARQQVGEVSDTCIRSDGASMPHVVLSCPCGWQVATPMTLEGDRWSNHLGPLPLHDCGSDALWLICRDMEMRTNMNLPDEAETYVWST